MQEACTGLKEESVLLDEIAALSAYIEVLHVGVVVVKACFGYSHPSVLEHIAAVDTEVEVEFLVLAVGESARIGGRCQIVLAFLKLCKGTADAHKGKEKCEC